MRIQIQGFQTFADPDLCFQIFAGPHPGFEMLEDPIQGLIFPQKFAVFTLNKYIKKRTLDPDFHPDPDPDPGTLKIRIWIQRLQKCGSRSETRTVSL